LDCGSPLPLCVASRALKKRQRAAAVQDAVARFAQFPDAVFLSRQRVGALAGSGAKSRCCSTFFTATATHKTASTMASSTAASTNHGHLYFCLGELFSDTLMFS